MRASSSSPAARVLGHVADLAEGTGKRTLKVTSVARGLTFPHAAQAIQITRRRKLKGNWSRQTCYAVTSLTQYLQEQARNSSTQP